MGDQGADSQQPGGHHVRCPGRLQHSLGFFLGAVVAGLLTAVAITWIQNKVRTKNDAAIGIVFTTMFALGVIGISRLSKNEGVHLTLL